MRNLSNYFKFFTKLSSALVKIQLKESHAFDQLVKNKIVDKKGQLKTLHPEAGVISRKPEVPNT